MWQRHHPNANPSQVIAPAQEPAPRRCTPRLATGLLLALVHAGAWAAESIPDHAESADEPPKDEATPLDEVEVVGRRRNLVGEAISASEGSVGQVEIAQRPLLRSGDLLEFVPGLVATQHSGSGKANQYFLRGFNLDHGTDFATFVDAMPVNMRTHGHGQGWTDLNFLIPEAVEELAYRKGTYYADVGDFSSTGTARFRIFDRTPDDAVALALGEYGYGRALALGSAESAVGTWLYGAEAQVYDGPWSDIDEDVDKANVLLRWSGEVAGGRGHLMFMGYDNAWNSADQIPQRAVDAGLISEFGSIDRSVGGESSRFSLSGGWTGAAFGGEGSASIYAIDSELDLYSNFTYFLDNPVDGDQFEQVDDRRLYGFELSQQWQRGRSRWRLGAEGRFDDIDEVGLYRTRERVRLDTVREDAVDQGSLGVYLANEFEFNERLRSYVGLRYDDYDFEVDAKSLPVNTGEADDAATSLKASLIFRPYEAMELYASYGQGFHSNDARGTTIRIDPVTSEAVDPVDPLVDSEGAELGTRIHVSDRLQATLAAWTLRLDSELLFVGDAGTTEASRPSRRDGVEFGLYWFGSEHLGADLEVSYTDARFRDDDPAGNEIPGAIPLVVGAGVTARSDGGWLASVRLRHFGAYPLIEDGSVESDGSTLLNLRVGREWARVGVYLDLFNLLDSDDHDIDYYYASRLPGEPAEGIEDVHFHVFEPRSVRLAVRYAF